MNVVQHHALARAGLIGNPSDGYGGKTIAFTLQNFRAQVVMYPWEVLEILGGRDDKNRFVSLDELVDDVDLHGYYGGVRLVKATIKKFAAFCRQQNHVLGREPFSIRYETNIPRGVGLAGSSAIVVATLKCLSDYYGVSIAPQVQASLARSVENDELGIACGFQDRVAQVYGGLMYMDFAEMRDECGYRCGRYERLDAAQLPPLYLAYDLAAAKVSADVHGPLRAAFNERLAVTMAEIAGLVPQARQALDDRDFARLNELINRNFDLRTTLYNIRPSYLDMIHTARGVGASAKFAGSGGSIVGGYNGEAMFQALQQALEHRNENWRVIKPTIET